MRTETLSRTPSLTPSFPATPPVLPTAAPATPKPSVQSVTGCQLDVPPSTLQCPPDVPALTITGAHFGSTGAAVALVPTAGGPSGGCAAVRHADGAEAETLVCERARLPGEASETRWFDVRVTTQDAGTATLPRALLSLALAYPTVSALAVTGPTCRQSTPTALTQCPRTGTHFGLQGRFPLAGPPEVYVGPLRCPVVLPVNATFLECRGLAGAGEALPVSVAVAGLRSHARGISLSFATQCGHKPGHWAGEGCADCESGYAGPACARDCPGSRPGRVCSGHGHCDDGLKGDGSCACSLDAATGYWAGPACDACHGHHWGPQCVRACPTGAFGAPGAGVVCSGHGTCDAGRNGTGTCACQSLYTGPECGLHCPGSAAGVLCGGHGHCGATDVPGIGACHCLPEGRAAVAGEGAGAGARGGSWGGFACERCRAGWAGPDCVAACPAAEGVPCRGRGECVWGGARAVCRCAGGYAGPACGLACPVSPRGLPCAGHGVCSGGGAENGTGAATCDCAPRWTGPVCSECLQGWTGPDCGVPCPQSATGGVCSSHGTCVASGVCLCHAGHCGAVCDQQPAECARDPCSAGFYGVDCRGVCTCGSHGTCLEGRHGTGHCVCAEGWAGPDCTAECQGGAVPSLCGGHGWCDGDTGECHCDVGWRTNPLSDGVCGTRCPGPEARPCHGHGNCTSDGLCHCQSGYGGAACGSECPQDAAGRRCGGHGECDAAGKCVCVRGGIVGHWAGAACDECVQGHWGPDCTAVCRSGVSIGRQCFCLPSWAGPGCTVKCPYGGLGLVCSGHGVCSSGNMGSGACLCLTGYAGSACDIRCDGGATRPCSGHGLCLAEGSCRCQASAAGHWAGRACDACAPGYAGLNCDRMCPRDARGQPCSGHGRCGAASTCTCYADAARGFWVGALCTRCAPAYYGPSCQAVCPGGPCRPCSGHGLCAEGTAGSGRCACDAHWVGTSCNGCVPGRWGVSCGAQCPGGAATPCSGHGVCSDGVLGTGECTCAAGPQSGWWQGAACAQCRAGYYGLACERACPLHRGLPCGGRGSCSDGLQGTGKCTCDLASGYQGLACHIPCPIAGGVVCNGRGVCTTDARCVCDVPAVGGWNATRTGHWAGLACADCAVGWAGPACSLPCPVDAAGRLCSSAGQCVTAADGTAAACLCRPGYAGSHCQRECPGGAEDPCGGHGVCHPVTGQCTCHASAEAGYWAGPDCRRCLRGWSGVQCLAACPLDAAGVPCSGSPCVGGVCRCGPGTCGPACNETTACDVLGCPAGRYGAACAQECPRTAAGVCNGHGQCLAKVYGTGLCTCDAGYAGVACEAACPAPSGRVCAGHGQCGALTGACICRSGHATADCSVPCPSPSGLLCSGHGRCRDGVHGDGACRCDAGYAKADCSGACPGVDPRGNASVACGGHGTCVRTTAQCRCWGHWAGVRCGDCADGWFGPQCRDRCVNGHTDAQVVFGVARA